MYSYLKGKIVISIHAPHEGERHDEKYRSFDVVGISIHAPHEGERQVPCVVASDLTPISIHAPHEGERRCVSQHHADPWHDFNPRSPRGGATRLTSPMMRGENVFQSTLPTRGSDRGLCGHSRHSPPISIHAPHEGERHVYTRVDGWLCPNFNPRSPRGGATG